jgi:hypothetical protein
MESRVPGSGPTQAPSTSQRAIEKREGVDWRTAEDVRFEHLLGRLFGLRRIIGVNREERLPFFHPLAYFVMTE